MKHNACLKTYIDINTDLRKKAKNDFKKDFFFQLDELCSFRKLSKMRENIDILNLSQQKEEGII